MAKLNKQYYYSKDGERRINCYHVIVPKHIVKKAGIDEIDELVVYAKGNKIIIEKGK